MKAHTPSRNTALICLIIFILGLIGCSPLAHIQYIGPYLAHQPVRRLSADRRLYLLLAAIYILDANKPPPVLPNIY